MFLAFLFGAFTGCWLESRAAGAFSFVANLLDAKSEARLVGAGGNGI
jgi:hypothetical protein